MRRILSVLLSFLISFITIFPAYAAESRLPLAADGQAAWNAISFTSLGSVESGDTGIVTDAGLADQIGYNPSRSYSAGTALSNIIKVGDLNALNAGNLQIGAFLGGRILTVFR